jgi:hypothetical protein
VQRQQDLVQRRETSSAKGPAQSMPSQESRARAPAGGETGQGRSPPRTSHSAHCPSLQAAASAPRVEGARKAHAAARTVGAGQLQRRLHAARLAEEHLPCAWRA